MSETVGPEPPELEDSVPPFRTENLSIWYGDKPALEDISLDVKAGEITAIIGPSGCGKSTFLGTLNRMRELIPGFHKEGLVAFSGVDVYSPYVDPAQLRRRANMVFQKPNPFPKSIYDNVAFGPRIHKIPGDMDEQVHAALERAGLWQEVKDDLGKSAMALSGGQQQRLCIARCLAVNPDVLLMDEPCSALDPIATGVIEDLLTELKQEVPILLVTHNMQQAGRVAQTTAFFHAESNEEGQLRGILVEVGPTGKIMTNPDDPRTDGFVRGRFG